MQVGDIVKLIGIPPGLHDEDDMMTLTLFQKCLGLTFPIIALDAVDGLPYPLAELHVGEVLGQEPIAQTIWVEPEHLKLVD